MLCLLLATVVKLFQGWPLIQQLMQAQHSAVQGSFNLILTSFPPSPTPAFSLGYPKSQRKKERKRKEKKVMGLACPNTKMNC